MMDRRQRNIALLVAGTFFMENLDGTIVSTAAPSMARSFGVASADIGVTITSYLLTMAVLIPLSGWVAQRWGIRRIFLLAIAVFTISSLLCALSVNVGMLTSMRVLQGVGAAMMVPVGRLSVLRGLPKSDVIKTIALLTWPALAAPVIAPALGGFFTTYLTWHWIFLVNGPLGVAAFVVALRLIPSVESVTPLPLDWTGLLLTCTGVAALVSLADLLAAGSLRPVPVTLLAAAAVALPLLAGRHLLRANHPLLNLRMMKVPTFRVSHSSGSTFRLTISAVPFLLPLMFQDGFGWSPLKAGSFVLFVFVGNLAIKPATTSMLLRFGFRTVLITSTTCAVVSMGLAGLLTPSTPAVLIAIVLVFGGVARSVGFTVYNTIAFADIDQQVLSEANTLSATVQQVAAGFGVAVAAVALTAGLTVTGWFSADADVLWPYRFAFFSVAALTLIPVIGAIRLHPAAGQSLRPVR